MMLFLCIPLVVLVWTKLVLGGELRQCQAFVPAGRKLLRRTVTAETATATATATPPTPIKAKQQRRRTASSSRHNLFFRSSDPAELSQQNKNPNIPSHVFSDLSYNISLPYEFDTRAFQSASAYPSDLNNSSVRAGSPFCIHLLKADDLKQITDLCVAEYGSEVSLESLLEDSKSPPSYTAIMDYLDCLLLRALVDLTMRMKLAGYDPTPTSALSSTSTTAYIPPDHAILVACQTDSGDIVGMVEIGRQPPLGDRNPPPIPIPLSLKRLYSLVVGAGEPQGWCTNLLIAPQYRGQSYSKVLMAAVEGLARRWQCTSIHLHADADSVAGKIPQRLHMNLGYEMLPDSQQDISWMGGGNGGVEGPARSLSSSVFVIEGVPLLYLQKQL